MAIAIQGELEKNEIGRWQIVPANKERMPWELNSGSVLEIYHHNPGEWRPTRIEYDHSIRDYYSIDGIALYTGRLARIQK